MNLRAKLQTTVACMCTLFILGCPPSPSAQQDPTKENNTKAKSSLAVIKEQKKIMAGWAPYPPYAFRNNATGRIEGYYIDLFNRVAEESKLEVVWIETTWGTMIADLNANKFQVMAAPVYRTIPRALEVAFTRPIDYFGYSIVIRKGDQRFKTVNDFNQAEVKITVTQGEVGHEYVKRHLPKATPVVHNTGDIALALVDVIQEKADAGICDAWTAKQFVKEHADKVVDLFANNPFNRVGAGWYVRSSDEELLRFLNASIDWLETSGTIEATSSGYELPSLAGPKQAPAPKPVAP